MEGQLSCEGQEAVSVEAEPGFKPPRPVCPAPPCWAPPCPPLRPFPLEGEAHEESAAEPSMLLPSLYKVHRRLQRLPMCEGI